MNKFVFFWHLKIDLHFDMPAPKHKEEFEKPEYDFPEEQYRLHNLVILA